ncbi:MAG: alpha/beta hydrolase [Chloroflexota bacterium]|nr:alpha/beta hydrolase [Chloroflexota bacterium]
MTAVNINPVERDLSVNGITLRVVTRGQRTSPERTVMLIHGITANSHYWADFGPFLAARGWFVIAPDLRGRGRSEKPAHGYGLPFHANDLLSLLDALDLPTVHLVGHSLGALIGLYLAALYPDRLARLVLVDAGGKLPPDTYQAIAPALARLGHPYPSLDAYLTAMRESSPLPWHPFGERYYRYDAEIQADGTVRSTVPRAAITEEQAAIALTRLETLPGLVTAPTLIVRATVGLLGGERGQILPRAEADRLLSAIAGSRLVEIPEANHYTVVLAGSFAQAVSGFLEA